MGETSEKSPSGAKYFRLSEIEEQKSIKSTWIIINYKVYDVTKFLEEVRIFHCGIFTGPQAPQIRRWCRYRGKRRNMCGKEGKC